MLRIFLIFFFASFSALAQEDVAKETYSNQSAEVPKTQTNEFVDVKGNIVNDYSKESPRFFNPAPPTPSRFFTADLSMPDFFGSTNNLIKKVGSFYRAHGEVIFVQGTITDSFGVPIQNAVIEIWQTNAAGKYHTLLEPGSEYIDKYFSMSGRAITDNLGNYHFITIMPGSNPGRAPHINMNVLHPKFGRLETEMYFEAHPYNKNDYQYLAYSQEEQKLLTATVHHQEVTNPQSIKLCTFNITLRGTHQYKRF
jgi:protocatechuate 3,4-dioxygenase beta subunit